MSYETQITVTSEDLQAFAVLCKLAEKHPNDLEQIGKEHNAKPEWLLGLQMKFEDAMDELDS